MLESQLRGLIRTGDEEEEEDEDEEDEEEEEEEDEDKEEVGAAAPAQAPLLTYFFHARETNFLVAAEEQSKNLESQLRGLIRTGEEEGRSYHPLLLLRS